MYVRNRPILALALLLLASAGCETTPVVEAGAPPRPNVLVILADDLGYGDVGALNRASTIPTPNFDRLASEGMLFTDAHSPSAVCTPTRYGLLTGRYCWRTRLKSGVLNGYGAPLIEDGRRTVADVLGGAGYATAIVGKWHLGLGWQRDEKYGPIRFDLPVTGGPDAHGFERSFIIPASLDFPPYVFLRDGRPTTAEVVEQKGQSFPRFLRKGPRGVDLVMEDVLDDLVREASAAIDEFTEDDAPFFLYVPLTSPHKPAWPHPRFVGTTELGPYGDFVAQTDATIGAILDALEASGAADDTLVIVTSDNGSYMYRFDDPDKADHTDAPKHHGFRPENHRANGPWRGTKADIWEAGHRVPFVARWPRRIEAGTTSDATICLVDLMATCAELAGARIEERDVEDSYSFAPHLLQRDAAERPPVVNHSVNGTFALRDGRWKLVASNGSGGREKPKGKPFGRPYMLFDLEADPGETTDLVEEHPEVAARLEAQLEAIRTR